MLAPISIIDRQRDAAHDSAGFIRHDDFDSPHQEQAYTEVKRLKETAEIKPPAAEQQIRTAAWANIVANIVTGLVLAVSIVALALTPSLILSTL
jgi:uncharacterized membrane protein